MCVAESKPRCLHCRRQAAIKGRRLCSRCWSRHRGAYPVLRTYRPWTAGERECLCRHWGQCGAPARIAAALGRDIRDVYEAAGRFGVRRKRVTLADCERTLRRMHAAGQPDEPIARRLRVSVTTVGRYRRLLGLPTLNPPGPFNEGRKRRCREARRKFLVRHGLRHFGERHELARRVAVARRGWGGAGTHTQADILDALEGGPKTRPELCKLLGKGDWLRHPIHGLLRQGFIVRAGRTRGRGHAVLWRLADGVRRGGVGGYHKGDR